MGFLDEAATGAKIITAFDLSNGTDQVKDLVENFKNDVFSVDFLGTVLLSTTLPVEVSESEIDRLASAGADFIILGEGVHAPSSALPTSEAAIGPLSGPFLVIDGCINAVYKLEVDRYRTFTFGAYPVEDGKFAAFDRVTTEIGDSWIPVPSRLYSAPGPLSGLRMAVKGESGHRS